MTSLACPPMVPVVGSELKPCKPENTDQMAIFINESNNKFTDISSEANRTYVFPGGDEVTIQFPTHLSVSAGGHRLFDVLGTSHYIPKGWIHLKWVAKHGHPNFVK